MVILEEHEELSAGRKKFWSARRDGGYAPEIHVGIAVIQVENYWCR